jgi:uncharacterized protein YfdQ (DUF2303 family)
MLPSAEPRREADAVAEIAHRAAEIQIEPLTAGAIVALRGDQDIHVEDLERFADRPRRERGQYELSTTESFLAYVAKHADLEQTTTWVHPTNGTMTAILNDHGAGAPGWRDHRAVLTLEATPAWKRWLAADRRMLTQEQFAEHIEESIPDIAAPPAAALLEIAQSISMTTTASFRSAKRLHDGRTQLTYNEDVETSAGDSGQMEIPRELQLVLSPFVGEDAIPVMARLRTRLVQNKLQIGYLLDRPEELVRETIDRIAGDVRAELGRVYIGTRVT